MSEDYDKIAAIITGLAQLYDKSLDDFTVKMYMEVLGGYDSKLIELAAENCVKELGFMPRPVEIINRIQKIENDAHHRMLRRQQIEHIPESDPTDDDRAFGTFVCKAMSGWMRSEFIQKQRKAGTFIDYDYSLFQYMAEQKMDQKHIDRLADTYPKDPRK